MSKHTNFQKKLFTFECLWVIFVRGEVRLVALIGNEEGTWHVVAVVVVAVAVIVDDVITVTGVSKIKYAPLALDIAGGVCFSFFPQLC